VPKLWNETVDAHRREVRDAILDTTAALAGRKGVRGLTMSEIAEQTGIGRATLYKYFPDVEAILLAWHEREVTGHLEHLAKLRDQPGDAGERLKAVLAAYALIHHGLATHHHGSVPVHGADVVALLHRGEHVARAQERVSDLVTDVLSEAAAAGVVRDDVTPEELASYCLHALTAASTLPSKAAVRRLVRVTVSGLSGPGPVR
jgi:AcrR family transcriptional regulator